MSGSSATIVEIAETRSGYWEWIAWGHDDTHLCRSTSGFGTREQALQNAQQVMQSLRTNRIKYIQAATEEERGDA